MNWDMATLSMLLLSLIFIVAAVMSFAIAQWPILCAVSGAFLAMILVVILLFFGYRLNAAYQRGNSRVSRT